MITEQEAQEYLNGNVALPDEALDLVSGGATCMGFYCPKCNTETFTYNEDTGLIDCYICNGSYNPRTVEKRY